MRPRLVGILVLLLASPALGTQAPKKSEQDKPATTAQKYQTLLDEDRRMMAAFEAALREAKKPEQRQQLFGENYPKHQLAPKFLALAEQHPDDPVAVDALVWVLSDTMPVGGTTREKASAILLRDHIESPKLGRALPSLAYSMDAQGEALLRGVLRKNPNKEVQAEAAVVLAQRLAQKIELLQRIHDNPEMAAQFESLLGKEQLAEMKKTKPADAENETANVFRELADKHLAHMTPERLVDFCRRLSFSPSKASEVLLRTLLEKGAGRDVHGIACLTLGQSLRQRADSLPPAQSKAADALRAESEKLLERAATEFADVKFPPVTVGAKAQTELFDLRRLAVGKLAPDIEGEDQDGKKFKLSDYQGKVVLLDFWSQF